MGLCKRLFRLTGAATAACLLWDAEGAGPLPIACDQCGQGQSESSAPFYSDILVVPHALGQGVTFAAGEGPLLDPIKGKVDIWPGNFDILWGLKGPAKNR